MTLETTVGELVRARPGRARVFEKLGIDYCCGGKIALAEACAQKGLDGATVLAMLGALDEAGQAASGANPDAMGLAELCDHIVHTHHDYLREELPRLDFMTRKVAAVHGDQEPRLLIIRRVFEDLSRELSAHTEEEESSVFPKIRALESANTDKAALNAELRAVITELEAEHDSAGAALARFRELSDGYTPPDWACNTFRALYHGLHQLETNMHQHVHKENNILFVKALAVA